MRFAISVPNSGALLLGATVAGYPIVAAISTIVSVPSFGISVTMRGGVVVISIILLLFAIYRSASFSFLSLFPLLLFVFFWVYYLAKLFLYEYLYEEQLGFGFFEYIGWSVGGCIIPFLALYVTPSLKFRGALILTWRALLCSALVVFIYGTFQVGQSSIFHGFRLSVDALNPISVGNLGVSLIVCTGWLFFYFNESGKNKYKFISVAVLGALLVVFSGSKGPLLSCFVVVCFFVIILKVGSLRYYGLLLLFLMCGLLFYFLGFELLVVERIASSFSGADQSTSIRIQLLLGGYYEFIGNPIIGGAFDEPVFSHYPHNIFVEAFMVGGFFGGSAVFLLLIISLSCAVRLVINNRHYGWVGLLFIQYFTIALFSGAIYNATVLWPVMGAVLSLWLGRRNFR